MEHTNARNALADVREKFRQRGFQAGRNRQQRAKAQVEALLCEHETCIGGHEFVRAEQA